MLSVVGLFSVEASLLQPAATCSLLLHPCSCKSQERPIGCVEHRGVLLTAVLCLIDRLGGAVPRYVTAS